MRLQPLVDRHPIWLAVKPELRLSDIRRPSGGVFRIPRRGKDFHAHFIGPIGMFPCEGMRDEESERALAVAFDKGGFQEVTRLCRTADIPDEDC